MWPVQELSRVYGEMQQAVASAERVFSLVDTEPDIKKVEHELASAEFIICQDMI